MYGSWRLTLGAVVYVNHQGGMKSVLAALTVASILRWEERLVPALSAVCILGVEKWQKWQVVASVG